MTPCKGILGDLDCKKIDEITNDIKKNGYHIFNTKLPSNIVKSLYSFAMNQECFPRPTDEDHPHSKQVIKTKYEPNNLKANVYDFDPNDVILNPNVQAIISDFSFLAIAQAYLNTTPKLEPPAFWWSTPYLKKADSNSAQLFHFDMDRIKWLKFFIFLTDVTIDNGPHVFVKGSHLSGKIPKDLLKAGYARLSNEDILKHYPEEDIQVFTVPAGSIIAEDTRGLHKGTNLVNGERLVLELQFSNCLFGAESKPIKQPKTGSFPDNTQDAFLTYPNTYKLFFQNILTIKNSSS
jgi:hypothetical protein